MELILLRHGKAEDSHAGGDFSRELVGKGRAQARWAARLLQDAGRLPELVLSSPRVRAWQTAEEFCGEAGVAAPLAAKWIDCGMHPETALSELRAHVDSGSVMMVGHEPDFSSLAEYLLGASGAVEVKKGALVGLAINPPSPRATLRFLVPPGLGGVS